MNMVKPLCPKCNSRDIEVTMFDDNNMGNPFIQEYDD